MRSAPKFSRRLPTSNVEARVPPPVHLRSTARPDSPLLGLPVATTRGISRPRPKNHFDRFEHLDSIVNFSTDTRRARVFAATTSNVEARVPPLVHPRSAARPNRLSSDYLSQQPWQLPDPIILTINHFDHLDTTRLSNPKTETQKARSQHDHLSPSVFCASCASLRPFLKSPSKKRQAIQFDRLDQLGFPPFTPLLTNVFFRRPPHPSRACARLRDAIRGQKSSLSSFCAL
jgi:hypothetical protein